MLEVLAPAGSSDALVAAVQNGADAVYLGYGTYNARVNAKNFTMEQLRQSVSYCHVRGVKVYLTLNTLILDKELKNAADVVLEAQAAGVDAILVQDLGVAQMVRQVAPDMPIHASTQMAVHSLEGVQKAAELGCTRVVLARELSKTEIALICRQSPVEIEVFVHGALCMCHSGQCYLSAMIGRRSGNRGQCAQPCRMSYGYDRTENRYPLSLKDNCLVQYLRELEAMGVACVKIEGRMKRAEYVAITTRIYKDAVNGRPVTAAQMKQLEKVFSRQGFTQGYFNNKKGSAMFGVHDEEEPDRTLLAQARATYENTEHQNVPVNLRITVYPEKPSELYASDTDGHTVSVQGPVPEPAQKAGMSRENLAERLGKTGGTPYYAATIQVDMIPGLVLSAASINAMRRDALSLLTAVRGQVPVRRSIAFRKPQTVAGSGGAVFAVEIKSMSQLTADVLAFRPAILYIPVNEMDPMDPVVQELIKRVRVCAVLPRVVLTSEWQPLFNRLRELAGLGIREVMVGNIGMIDPMRRAGFQVRGDFGLNVFNSGTANYLAEQGLASITASFELTLPQIRDLSKPVPMEMFAYGRLPLMVTENCIIHNRAGRCICTSTKTSLVDRTGSRFPIIRDPGTCRSLLLNSKKLYMGDRLKTLAGLGVRLLRISFTTENEQEIRAVLAAFQSGAAFDSGVNTRGLYIRGVE